MRQLFALFLLALGLGLFLHDGELYGIAFFVPAQAEESCGSLFKGRRRLGTTSKVKVELVPGASVPGHIVDETRKPVKACMIVARPADIFRSGRLTHPNLDLAGCAAA